MFRNSPPHRILREKAKMNTKKKREKTAVYKMQWQDASNMNKGTKVGYILMTCNNKQ